MLALSRLVDMFPGFYIQRVPIMGKSEVKLYIYDMASQVSEQMGIPIPKKKIWHSSIVVFEKEYSYGSKGITITAFSDLDAAYDIRSLGYTEATEREFTKYIESLESEWSGSTYHLWHHNCHQFARLIVDFLGVSDLPSYVSSLPEQLNELSPKCSIQSAILDVFADVLVNFCGSDSSITSRTRRYYN